MPFELRTRISRRSYRSQLERVLSGPVVPQHTPSRVPLTSPPRLMPGGAGRGPSRTRISAFCQTKMTRDARIAQWKGAYCAGKMHEITSDEHHFLLLKICGTIYHLGAAICGVCSP